MLQKINAEFFFSYFRLTGILLDCSPTDYETRLVEKQRFLNFQFLQSPLPQKNVVKKLYNEIKKKTKRPGQLPEEHL